MRQLLINLKTDFLNQGHYGLHHSKSDSVEVAIADCGLHNILI